MFSWKTQKEKLIDKYLTWKTGKSLHQRTWEKWRDETICYRATTVENYFSNFKYIVQLDPDKVWNHNEPFGWVPVEGFKQYEYPNRPLGQNTVINWFRGERNQWDGKFHINEMFGSDYVFAATNREDDAVMISLKYG